MYDYQIVDIHTDDRFPGILYAKVKDDEGDLCVVSATLEYCYHWIERLYKKENSALQNKIGNTNKVEYGYIASPFEE